MEKISSPLTRIELLVVCFRTASPLVDPAAVSCLPWLSHWTCSTKQTRVMVSMKFCSQPSSVQLCSLYLQLSPWSLSASRVSRLSLSLSDTKLMCSRSHHRVQLHGIRYHISTRHTISRFHVLDRHVSSPSSSGLLLRHQLLTLSTAGH